MFSYLSRGAMVALCAALSLVGTQAHAEGDAEKGKRVAVSCKACHSFSAEQKRKMTGPTLWNIVGRGIAEIEDYTYSNAYIAKKGTVVWDEETLDAYLKAPRKWEPKTKMVFAGVKDDAKRADLIAYLKTLSE